MKPEEMVKKIQEVSGETDKETGHLNDLYVRVEEHLRYLEVRAPVMVPLDETHTLFWGKNNKVWGFYVSNGEHETPLIYTSRALRVLAAKPMQVLLRSCLNTAEDHYRDVKEAVEIVKVFEDQLREVRRKEHL